ncbi:MAG: DUF924 domain-containing protein [Sphingomonadales bacterium]|nr:MAG: DUF924 domain-containing protein [Sphingomonadales bacterium]
MDAVDVHAGTAQVLGFWFGLSQEEQFAKSADLDRQIGERFGTLRDLVLADGAKGWHADRDTMLAAIILLDQFSRNLHRGSAEAFAADPLALVLALETIERGWDLEGPPEQRQFLYMPLMHSEDAAMQALSVEKFEALGNPLNLRFARDHADVIERFGRYPSRNAALGRESSAEELDYLSQPDAGW